MLAPVVPFSQQVDVVVAGRIVLAQQHKNEPLSDGDNRRGRYRIVQESTSNHEGSLSWCVCLQQYALEGEKGRNGREGRRTGFD